MPMHACPRCHLTDETRAAAGPRAPLPCACNAVLIRPAVDEVAPPVASSTRRAASAFAGLLDQDRYTVTVAVPVPARTP